MTDITTEDPKLWLFDDEAEYMEVDVKQRIADFAWRKLAAPSANHIIKQWESYGKAASKLFWDAYFEDGVDISTSVVNATHFEDGVKISTRIEKAK
jgi:hypothetical protein